VKRWLLSTLAVLALWLPAGAQTLVFQGNQYGDVSKAVWAITPAQFDAITSSAGTNLLPAPGTGQAIVVLNYTVEMQYAGIQYATGTGALVIECNGSLQVTIVSPVLSSGNITSAVSQFGYGNALTGAATGITACGNAPVALSLSTGSNYTTGNSNFILAIWYRIINL
jgi:hypothetical protein